MSKVEVKLKARNEAGDDTISTSIVMDRTDADDHDNISRLVEHFEAMVLVRYADFELADIDVTSELLD